MARRRGGTDRGGLKHTATPAVAALVAAGVPHVLHTFEVALDGGGESFGAQVAHALGVPRGGCSRP